jgi:hypothetical protein
VASIQLYDDLVKEIPEFSLYDTYERSDYLETDISPLGQIGYWLNELQADPKNAPLISRVCNFLNDVFYQSKKYERDIINDFGVYFFWALDYQTIDKIKPYLKSEILEDGRKYLRSIDGENYQDF